VWTVLGYGAEIWRWKEREGVERIEERYLRWVLGVDPRTPVYMIREELQREKLRTRAGRRAWSFEKRLEEGRGSELARECRREIRERGLEGKKGTFVGWEKERREYFKDRGIKLEEMERKKEDGELRWEDIESRGKRRQRDERWERINNSEYNKWYKQIKGEGIPGYLKKEWGENRWRRGARFRLGSEVRGGRY